MTKALSVLAASCLGWVACHKQEPLPPIRPVTRPQAKSDVQKGSTSPDAEPRRESTMIGPSTGEGSGAGLLKGATIDPATITIALRDYVASRQLNPDTVKSLDVLVEQKFLPHLPPPPPGKKYVWSRTLVVSFADK